jgi:hypothetical protein
MVSRGESLDLRAVLLQSTPQPSPLPDPDTDAPRASLQPRPARSRLITIIPTGKRAQG